MSTTSVFPSQWPRAVAHPQLHVRPDVRPPVERDDPIQVVIIPYEHDASGRLENLGAPGNSTALGTPGSRHRVCVSICSGLVGVSNVSRAPSAAPPPTADTECDHPEDPRSCCRLRLAPFGCPRLEFSGAAHCRVQRMGPGEDRVARALHVGLPVRCSCRRPGPGGRRGPGGLALGGHRYRHRHERDAHRQRHHRRCSLIATAPSHQPLNVPGIWVVLLPLKRVAIVVKQLEVGFGAAIEHHAHLPRTREDLRILDRDFVVDVIAVGQRIALHDVQRVAVKSCRSCRTRSRR